MSGFAWLNTADARKMYERDMKAGDDYLLRMDISSNIVDIMDSVSSHSIYFLSKQQLNQAKNYPAFLIEQVLARYGDDPGSKADRASKIKFHYCLK
jgi:hypothetical protein